MSWPILIHPSPNHKIKVKKIRKNVMQMGKKTNSDIII